MSFWRLFSKLIFQVMVGRSGQLMYMQPISQVRTQMIFVLWTQTITLALSAHKKLKSSSLLCSPKDLVQGAPHHAHPPSRPLFSPQQLQYPKHQSKTFFSVEVWFHVKTIEFVLILRNHFFLQYRSNLNWSTDAAIPSPTICSQWTSALHSHA